MCIFSPHLLQLEITLKSSPDHFLLLLLLCPYFSFSFLVSMSQTAIRIGFTPQEIEFIAEAELIYITPFMRMDALQFIGVRFLNL